MLPTLLFCCAVVLQSRVMTCGWRPNQLKGCTAFPRSYGSTSYTCQDCWRAKGAVRVSWYREPWTLSCESHNKARLLDSSATCAEQLQLLLWQPEDIISPFSLLTPWGADISGKKIKRSWFSQGQKCQAGSICLTYLPRCEAKSRMDRNVTAYSQKG